MARMHFPRYFSRLTTALCFCVINAVLISASWAAWPASPVKVVVPYAPGGPADTLGRAVADVLERANKSTFLVDNRPGGSGTVAPLAVAKSAPDGQTLLVTGMSFYVLGLAQTDTGYHPMRDFSHVALLGGTPFVLVVNAKLPIDSVKSLVDYAALNKQGISFGSVGSGTIQYLMGEKFASAAHVPSMISVGYKGDANILTDVMGGHIQAAFMTLGAAKAHIKSGALRAIAISSAKRNSDLKTIPTFAELGFPQLTATLWFCLSAPGGLPQDLMDKMSSQVRMGFQQPEAQKVLSNQDIEFPDYDAKETQRFIEAEILRWKR